VLSTNLNNIRAYYYLAKPGIVYGNVLSAVAGYLFIAKSNLDPTTFIAMVFGIAYVIGSACVLNNYFDRNIDAKMPRTSKRALVTGKISIRNALIYSAVLGVLGFGLLIAKTNWLTVIIGLIGYIDYIVVYGYAKRRTNYSTSLGSISGSAAIVAGYTTYTNKFDGAAIALFLIMVFWQMAHFHAIALYRLKDYKAAGVTTLPFRKGLKFTRTSIQLYIIAFTLATILLVVLRKIGYSYAVVMIIVGSVWFRIGLDHKLEPTIWAKRMFKFSLVVLLIFSALLCLNVVLP
jgi:protoheme IX farnesyltransferase